MAAATDGSAILLWLSKHLQPLVYQRNLLRSTDCAAVDKTQVERCVCSCSLQSQTHTAALTTLNCVPHYCSRAHGSPTPPPMLPCRGISAATSPSPLPPPKQTTNLTWQWFGQEHPLRLLKLGENVWPFAGLWRLPLLHTVHTDTFSNTHMAFETGAAVAGCTGPNGDAAVGGMALLLVGSAPLLDGGSLCTATQFAAQCCMARECLLYMSAVLCACTRLPKS